MVLCGRGLCRQRRCPTFARTSSSHSSTMRPGCRSQLGCSTLSSASSSPRSLPRPRWHSRRLASSVMPCGCGAFRCEGTAWLPALRVYLALSFGLHLGGSAAAALHHLDHWHLPRKGIHCCPLRPRLQCCP